MKKNTTSVIITATFLICAAVLSAAPAQAALSARYEGRVGGSQSAPAKPQTNTVGKTIHQPPVQQQTNKGATLISSQKLSKKYAAVIEKHQKEFYTAMVNAEMGLRYIFQTYKGNKEPSDAQFKAMKFAAELLIKDAQGSARRYARDLRFAKMAMLQMDEKERTLFAKALALVTAGPAFAAGIDASAMDSIASGLDSVANSTPNIDNRTIKDIMKTEQERNEAEASYQSAKATICTAGIIGASGTKVVTTAAGTLLGMMTGGPVGGTGAFIGGVSATTVATIEFANEISDAAGTPNKTTEGETKVINTLNTVAVIGNAVNAATSVTEVTKNVTNSSTIREVSSHIINTVIDSTQSVKEIKEIISKTPDTPDAPGSAGTKAVKEAEKSGGNNDGGNGGGGSGGCGC